MSAQETSQATEPEIPAESRFSELLCRAKTPRIGDTFRKGEQVATVKAVADGKVWYDITHGNYEPSHCCEEIEDYVRLVDKTITNGATFEAA